MKITKHKSGEITIRLDAKERGFLKVILARYNSGRSAQAIPANGFPLELLTQLKAAK
jgi:hypothetical protein